MTHYSRRRFCTVRWSRCSCCPVVLTHHQPVDLEPICPSIAVDYFSAWNTIKGVEMIIEIVK